MHKMYSLFFTNTIHKLFENSYFQVFVAGQTVPSYYNEG